MLEAWMLVRMMSGTMSSAIVRFLKKSGLAAHPEGTSVDMANVRGARQPGKHSSTRNRGPGNRMYFHR